MHVVAGKVKEEVKKSLNENKGEIIGHEDDLFWQKNKSRALQPYRAKKCENINHKCLFLDTHKKYMLCDSAATLALRWHTFWGRPIFGFWEKTNIRKLKACETWIFCVFGFVWDYDNYSSQQRIYKKSGIFEIFWLVRSHSHFFHFTYFNISRVWLYWCVSLTFS